MGALFEELAAPLLIAAIGYFLGRAHARFEREELKSLHHLEEELGSRQAAPLRRKLSDEQERELTRLYSETRTPISQIASRFGIGQTSVQRMAQRHGATLRGQAGRRPRPTLPENLPASAQVGDMAEVEPTPQPNPAARSGRVRARVAAAKAVPRSRRQAAPQTPRTAPPQALPRRKRQTPVSQT